MDNGLNGIEIKRRKIRWWFNVGSSAIIVALGLFFLGLRFLGGKNPFGDRYWLLVALVLGYGAVRLAFHLWRKKHLFDDLEDEGMGDP